MNPPLVLVATHHLALPQQPAVVKLSVLLESYVFVRQGICRGASGFLWSSSELTACNSTK